MSPFTAAHTPWAFAEAGFGLTGSSLGRGKPFKLF